MASSEPTSAVPTRRELIEQDDATAEELLPLAVDRRGDVVVLHVGGELDLLTAPRLTEAMAELLDEEPRMLVLDLLGVGFLGSSGLAALVAARDAAQRGNIGLRLVCGTDAVLRPFAATALVEVFDIHPDLDSALS